MPADYSSFDIADCALLAAGTLVLIGGAAWVSVRHRWRDQFTLPPPPPNRLGPLDLLIGFAALMYLPAVLGQAIFHSASLDTTSQAEEGSLGKVLSVTISQTLTIVVLLAIGRDRLAGGLKGWGLLETAWPDRKSTRLNSSHRL